MTFIKSSANNTPIVDTVFAIVKLAKKDIEENGSENVVDATIGSLYDESGKIVAYDSVFNHYDEINHATKAKYAESFKGNANYRNEVYHWVTQGKDICLPHDVIATQVELVLYQFLLQHSLTEAKLFYFQKLLGDLTNLWQAKMVLILLSTTILMEITLIYKVLKNKLKPFKKNKIKLSWL